MKKITILLLCLVCILTACKQPGTTPANTETRDSTANTETYDSTANTETRESYASSETCDYIVNSNLPNYKIKITYNSTENETATSLFLLEEKTNKEIQYIKLNDNYRFTEKPVSIIDINFDGYADVLVPRERAASAQYFMGFVWDTSKSKLIYTPTFEALPNVALDSNEKVILSSRSGDQTTSYSISTFDTNTNDFKVIKTLYYYPEGENTVYKEEQFENGAMQLVAEFTIPKKDNNIYSMHPDVASYYSENSDWDLTSKKWRNYLTLETTSSQDQTDDPYALHEITDERITLVEDKKVFDNTAITLSVPSDWKCMEVNGEDGSSYFFQHPTLGEKCRISFGITGSVYLFERTEAEYLAYLSYCGYKDVKITTFEKDKIDGYTCTKVVFSYSLDNAEFVGIHYENLVEDVRLYDFSITYPASEQKTFEPVFNSILDSIKFTPDN